MISMRQSVISLAITGCVLMATACTANTSPKGKTNVEPVSTREVVSDMAEGRNIQVEPMFEERLDHPEMRFQRLEREVQSLREDLGVVLVRMVEMKQEMRSLSGEPDPLVREDSVTAPVPVKPQTPSSKKKVDNSFEPASLNTTSARTDQSARRNPEAGTPATSDTVNAAVTNIRFGEHVDKTRIVLDVTGETEYTATLSDNGRRVIVTLPKVNWNGPQVWTSATAPIVTGYTATPRTEGGYTVAFKTSVPVNIKNRQLLPPRAQRGYGIVIDLFNPDMHLAQ